METNTVMLLYTSGNDKETELLDQMLERVPDVPLEVVAEGSLLKDKADLPFISTPDGLRIVGVDNIRLFLDRVLNGNASSSVPEPTG